jgi:hypothetical protein
LTSIFGAGYGGGVAIDDNPFTTALQITQPKIIKEIIYLACVSVRNPVYPAFIFQLILADFST